jgi:3-hydroxyacyl-[acyl-carrier-protein] dehydratase
VADPPLSIEAIQRLLPHRDPILLIDRVLEATPEAVVAEKLVSGNEPFLQGHFPGNPVMPGVLIVEAMAQAACVGVMLHHAGGRRRGVALIGIDKARFRRPVVPGDVLRLAIRLVRARSDLFRIQGSATVAGERAAEAELLAGFVDWEGAA